MTKKGIKNKIVIAFVALFVGCFSVASVMRVFATTESAMLSFVTNGDVTLDGSSAGQVTVSLTAASNGKLYTAQGAFSTTEQDDSDHYFAVNSFVGSSVIGENDRDRSLSSGQFWYRYGMAGDGINFTAGDHLYEMTYDVAADTPAGTYHLPISVEYVQTEDLDAYEEEVVVSATVTVIRNDAPAEKPAQVVTFRDGSGNPVTGLTQWYGDADIEITKEVTTGDGVITEYHPDDDGTGRVAHTDPSSDMVGFGEPGSVEICAWVAETETYAATRACYTVEVTKRPISITGATITDKTFDGTTDADVTAVTFSDLGNGALPTYTAEGAFGTADAGVDKAIRVDVTLTDEAVDRYTLSPSYLNTTKTILPFTLNVEGVGFSSGTDTYAYDPDGVEPGVTVTANVHGGTSTLTEGTDYQVEYVNNSAVGYANAIVTGMGNYTTSGPGIVLPFTITKMTIVDSDVTVATSIVEGHILADSEVSVNVDGHNLTQCVDAGDTNCDYLLTITNNTGVVGDTVGVRVEGRNNYEGTVDKNVNVVAKLPQTVTIADVTDTTVNKSYGDESFSYIATSTGNGDITYRSTAEAVATVDMNTGEVSIVGVGDADIIATAAENGTYAEGSAKYTVHVDKKVITVTNATVADKTFDNTPVATVSDVTLSEGSLVYDTDFTATGLFNDVTPAIRNVNVMVALTSEAYKNYCFMYESSCIQNTSYAAIGTIMPFTLGGDNAVAELTEDTFVYNGSEQCPAANVRVDLNGNGIKDVVLSAGTDYDVVCSNNVNVGTSATATITGKGNYTGSLEGLTFSITPVTVEDVVVTAASQDYTGEPLEPVLTVTGTVNGESKTFTTDDYEVATHGNFIDAGDYTVTINPKDGSNYNIPNTSGTFTINKAASGNPAEMTAGLKIAAGCTLAELGERTVGFVWTNPDTVVGAGNQTFPATYLQNDDSTNYTPVTVDVPVYGLKRLSVVTAIMGEGGEVTNPGDLAVEEDELTWTISPDEGYELESFVINSEDKTSEVSGGRFTMIAGTDNVTAIVRFRKVYEVINGAGQTHIRGVDGVAEFEIDAEYELFEDDGKVYVDGELVDPENYDSRSGSTIITLSEDYLNSLTLGEHALAVVFADDGVARTTFIIADPEAEDDNPAAADTGVFTGATGGAIATGASVMVIGALVSAMFFAKKNRKE